MSHLDRASPGDVVNLAVDRGTVPMNIAALLTFDPADRPLAADVADVVGARVVRVPRLTRRLVGTPLGCGRPVWVDDGSFSVGAHLAVQPLAAGPGDPALEAATGLVLRRLPRDRPLWTARVLVDDGGRASDLVIVMHHALADGIGGLAVLAALADGAPDGAVRRPPRPLPPPVDLARDAWRERVQGARDAGTRLRGLRSGLRELGGGLPHLAEPTTLLASPSAQRRVDVLEAPLEPVVSAAHAAGARVNDVVVVAVADALGALLRSRQDPLTTLVVSVPVSARSATTAGELGNRVGVMPLAVPLTGDRAERLAAVVRQRARLGVGAPRGSSGAATSMGFRTLAALGLFQPFVNRQRLVHTFVSNLRGPDEPVVLAGGRVTRVAPIAITPGNVTASFDVLSLAGRLVVSVVTDPVHVPDHALLRDALAAELAGLGA